MNKISKDTANISRMRDNMELKEYTKNLINDSLLNDSQCSYYFYRLLQGTVALVVYDYERNEKISFHYPNK